MLQLAAFLTAVGPVALMVTKAVDFLRNLLDKNDTAPKWTWNVAAFAIGVGYTLVTATNFVDLIVGLRPEVSSRLSGTWGQVFTGLALGATASFWHEHLSKTSAQSKTLSTLSVT